jgi:hypothetical protein
MNRKKNKRKQLPLQDGVLVCDKRIEKRKVSVCVSAIPSLNATATSLKTAEELLLNKLWAAYDLDEPIAFQYRNDHNLDRDEALVRIAPNEPVDASDPPAIYFSEGFCPICQSANGVRNSKPLKLKRIATQAKAGLFVRFQPILKFGQRIHMRLLRDSICETITEKCDVTIEFRRVNVEIGPRSTFFEVISKETIPCVVPRLRTGRAGAICSQCGQSFIYQEALKLFIREEHGNLIRQQGAAVINSNSDPILCVSGNVWREIKKLKQSRGLMAYPVYELKEGDICKSPKFEQVVPFKL